MNDSPSSNLRLSDERLALCAKYIDSFGRDHGSFMGDVALALAELKERRAVETTEEVARLRAVNAELLNELHHHFGCDSECEKRHAVKTEAKGTGSHT